LHKTGNDEIITVLRNREKTGNQRREIVEKVREITHLPQITRHGLPFVVKIFVKNCQK